MERAVFDKFRELIYQACGIHLTEQKEALVSARVGKRMRALNITDYGEYYKWVVRDQSGSELVELVNAISTNVTHFYREKRHFDFMAETLKRWSEQKQDRLRIWCAASSTGEEPYTLAITASENFHRPNNIQVVASDISTKVLQIARFGVYKDQDVRNIPAPVLKRYFQKGVGRANGLYRVRQPLRDMVSFRQVNLSTPPYPIEGPLDMIFCRNVMIYFNQDLRRVLVKNMESLLRPGGFLFVGLAESLSGAQHHMISVEPSVYRKKG